MGSQAWLKALLFGVCFWLSRSSSSSLFILQAEAAGGAGFVGGNVFIDSRSVIGRIDDDFVCTTLDWWPPEKCDYGTCSWGRASLLNLVLLLSFSFSAFYFLQSLIDSFLNGLSDILKMLVEWFLKLVCICMTILRSQWRCCCILIQISCPIFLVWCLHLVAFCRVLTVLSSFHLNCSLN